MSYQPVRYKLQLKLGGQVLDLGDLEWTDITAGEDGLVWRFRDPKADRSFKVMVSGRALNETPVGQPTLSRDYTEEEIELAMLLAIRDEISFLWSKAMDVSEQENKPLELKLETDQRVDANSSHLRQSVVMVNS